MELLQGSPYLLDPETAPRIVKAADELQGQVDLLRSRGHLSGDTLKQLRDEWGVVQVYESAGIEGNQLDLSETRMAIQRGITISGKPPEQSDEVRHLHDALQFLEKLAESKSALTEHEIKEIHSLILGRADADRGKYRTVAVEITNSPHKPPNPILVPEKMNEFCRWLEARHSVVPTPLLVATCHAWLVHIHPFRDGNGRTARAITNLLLMRQGFPILLIRRKDRQRYYEALRNSDDGDIGPFLELLVDRCRDSIRQIDRIRKAADGLSLALEEVRAADERRFRTWVDGIRLLATALEDAFKVVEESGASFEVQSQRYDLPSFDDYVALSQRDASGATWLERYDVRRGERRHSTLLWIGFSSDQLMSGTKTKVPFPSVWISMENPQHSPRWIPADDTFPFAMREVAFIDGQFVALLPNGQVRKHESVTALAAEFVSALVSEWFAE